MTSKERILRAMIAKPVDRVACCPRMWKFARAYYGAYDAKTTLRCAHEFGYDPIFYTGSSLPNILAGSIPSQNSIPDDVRFTSRTQMDEECDMLYRRFETPAGVLTDAWKRPHPNVGYGISPSPVPVECLLKGHEDLEAFCYLSGQVSAASIQQFKDLTAMYGDRGLISPYVRSPFNDLSCVYPVEDLLILPYTDPRFLRDVLAFLQEQCLMDIKAYLEAGSLTIFISGFHISLSVGWSPAIFREFFLPLIKEQVQIAHEAGAFLHYYDDGKVMGILDMMMEADVDVFSTCTPAPAGDFDLRAAKQRVGNRMTLMGYVDIEHVLHQGTPELVEATVKEAIEIGAADDAFVLSTSDGVLTQTPVENMQAYFAAARKYGFRKAVLPT